MKKRLLSQVFCLIIAIGLGCTREVNIQVADPVVQGGQVGGKIVLPPGSKVDTVGLKVFSALTSTAPANSGYSIDIAGKTSTTLLMNKAGDVLLMGYNYPGQNDTNLSPESTALAMLMNTLTMSSLTTEGKLDAIRRIKAEPAYIKFTNEVSATLRAGKSVTDTSNVTLFQSMALVFKNATNLRVAATQSYAVPILIKTANTELLLQNSYVSNTYVAGIYKDGKNLTRLTIKGRRIFATSLTDLAAGLAGDGYGIPDPVTYSMASDGEYSVVIRSGKPFSGDDSPESVLARRENVHFFILDLLLDHLPIPAGCLKTTVEAIKDVAEGLLDKREFLLNNAKSPEEFAAVALELTGEVFVHSNEIAKECTKLSDDSFSFLKGIGRLFKAVSIASKLFVGGNIMSHTNDLFQAKAAMDTCFQVVGLKLVKCGEKPTYLVKSIDGDIQKGEPGKELEKPLKVKVTFEDGKPANKTLVNWIVRSGGGTVSSLTSETNYEGLTEVKWKIGAGSGTQQVEAYVNKKTESKSALFTASASVAGPFKIEIISKNATGTFYTNPIKVRVTGADGKPVPQVELDWIAESGLLLNSFERFTNYEGIAQATATFDTFRGISLKILVKNDPSKSAVMSPVEFIAGISSPMILYSFIDINDKRDALPNPCKIIFVDKHFIPFPGLKVGITPSVGGGQDIGSYTDESGILHIRRADMGITQYKIEIYDVGGRVSSSWSNITIK